MQVFDSMIPYIVDSKQYKSTRPTAVCSKIDKNYFSLQISNPNVLRRLPRLKN